MDYIWKGFFKSLLYFNELYDLRKFNLDVDCEKNLFLDVFIFNDGDNIIID